MFERVPQCDFADVQPSRVCVDGRAYFFMPAFEIFAKELGISGPQAAMQWSQLSHEESSFYYDLENKDKQRAHAERKRMLDAITSSPYHECFLDLTTTGIYFGVAWNLGAYYVYLDHEDAMWIYGYPEAVVDAVMSQHNSSLAGPFTTMVVRQSLAHKFAMGELQFRYSACPPTAELTASVAA